MEEVFLKEIIKNMIMNCLAVLMMVIMTLEKYLNNKKATLLMKYSGTICND